MPHSVKYDVTIICPAYNEEDLAYKSISQIIEQIAAYQILAEIIVIDDCSTDNTWAELLKLKDKAKILKTDRNSGSGGAPRNIGIDAAQGDYIIFYDIGDELILEKLNPTLAVMNEQQLQIAVMRHEDIDLKGQVHPTPIKIFLDQAYTTNFHDTPALISNPFSWAKIYLTSWIKERQLYFGNQYSGQDKVFTWRAYLNADLILISPDVMYQHRFFTDGRNRMTKINFRLVQSLQSIDQDVRPSFQQFGLEKIYNSRLINRDIFGILLGDNGIYKLVDNEEIFGTLDFLRQWLEELSAAGVTFADVLDPQYSQKLKFIVNGYKAQFLYHAIGLFVQKRMAAK